jgi:hypothetical protein
MISEKADTSPPSPKVSTPSKNSSAPSTADFLLRITSLDTSDRITFINPHIETFGHTISSSEEAFSRPFARAKNAQSIDAPSESFSFPDLLLDARFRSMGTRENPGQPPNIEGIIEKLKRMMKPNIYRMSKQRLSLMWGAKIIGQPGSSYVYLNNLDIKGDQYDDYGNYVTARLSMSFTMYENI